MLTILHFCANDTYLCKMSSIKLKARCPYCGELFIKNRPKQVYCSNSHRVSHFKRNSKLTILPKMANDTVEKSDDTLEGNVLYDVLVGLNPKTIADDDFFC
jgi:DNA-directed RNA polymerase subunit RPC12/RpoP